MKKSRHNAIKFVTPAQRHSGQDVSLLARRERVYTTAKHAMPQRWKGRQTLDWQPVVEVWLNPEEELPHPQQKLENVA